MDAERKGGGGVRGAEAAPSSLGVTDARTREAEREEAERRAQESGTRRRPPNAGPLLLDPTDDRRRRLARLQQPPPIANEDRVAVKP